MQIPTIDFKQMKRLEMPPKRYNMLCVSVTEMGYMTINEKLFAQIEQKVPDRKLEIDLSQDDRIIVLRKTEDADFLIPKTRRIKYQEFANELLSFGYNLPAKYIVAWDERIDSWVGCLEEVPPAPDKGTIKKMVRTRKGK